MRNGTFVPSDPAAVARFFFFFWRAGAVWVVLTSYGDQKSAGGIPLPNRRFQEVGIFHLLLPEL